MISSELELLPQAVSTAVRCAVYEAAAKGACRDPELVIRCLADSDIFAESKRIAKDAWQAIQDGEARLQAAQVEEDRARERARLAAAKPIAELMVSAIADGFDPRGYFVYALWGEGGEPLYVGKSENILARLGQHMADWRKKDDTRSITLLRCRDAKAMARTEAALIRYYQPYLNVVGVVPARGGPA